MSYNNICAACGRAVVWSKRAEDGRSVALDAEPLRPSRYAPKRGTRIVDARKAYLPDHMSERLDLHRTPADRLARDRLVPPEHLADYPWHAEHKCGGR